MSALSSQLGGRKTLGDKSDFSNVENLDEILDSNNFDRLKDFLREYLDTYEGTTDMLIQFFLDRISPFLQDVGENDLVKYIQKEWDCDMVRLTIPSLIAQSCLLFMRIHSEEVFSTIDKKIQILLDILGSEKFGYDVIDIWYAIRYIKIRSHLALLTPKILEILEYVMVNLINNLDLKSQDAESVGDLMNEFALVNLRESFFLLVKKGFSPSVFLFNMGNRLNPSQSKVFLFNGKYSEAILKEYLQLKNN